MNRRTIGRGRVIAGTGAVVTLVACFLPWYTVGGDGGLPAISSNAFDGTGILVFLAAVGVLALIALPYAAGDQRLGIDRPAAFVASSRSASRATSSASCSSSRSRRSDCRTGRLASGWPRWGWRSWPGARPRSPASAARADGPRRRRASLIAEIDLAAGVLSW